MPSQLKLLTAFEKGYVRNLHFTNNDELGPPTGAKWLLLSGRIAHATGTASHLRSVLKSNNASLTGVVKILIAGADPTESYNVFEGTPLPVDATHTTLSNGFYIIPDDQELILTGDANVSADIQVLEWFPEVI